MSSLGLVLDASVLVAAAMSQEDGHRTLDREQIYRAPADVEAFTPEQTLADWWPH